MAGAAFVLVELEMAEALKALRIRSGVVRRLRKELAAYTAECEREQEKLEKMRADGADKHDIKQQVCGRDGVEAAPRRMRGGKVTAVRACFACMCVVVERMRACVFSIGECRGGELDDGARLSAEIRAGRGGSADRG